MNFAAPQDFDLAEMDEAANLVTRSAHPDARVYWGVSFDEALQDAVRVTVIATGFSSERKPAEPEKKKDDGFASPFISSASTDGAENASSAAAKDDDDGGFIDIMSIFNKRRD